MKKILIIIVTVLFLGGCYDNVELNDLSLISGIGIDYINDEYLVIYEVLNDNKSDNATDLLSYTVDGSGKTISDAFINANYKLGKKAYFAHLKLMILSENVINNHLENIIDYILRDTNIRDEFNVLISSNPKPN